jgi:hypothetical protein
MTRSHILIRRHQFAVPSWHRKLQTPEGLLMWVMTKTETAIFLTVVVLLAILLLA